jgi:hypothetical protein
MANNPDERGLKFFLIGLALMAIGYLVQFSGIAVVPGLIAVTGFFIAMTGSVMHNYVVIKRLKMVMEYIKNCIKPH